MPRNSAFTNLAADCKNVTQ